MVMDISGIKVKFPYEPYQLQVKIMEKMILALQTGQNALIESPTGTGKSLCLLCSVLAWREALAEKLSLEKKLMAGGYAELDMHIMDLRLQELSKALSSTQDLAFVREVPKVYYASRTHSQLSQAVKELKKTEYRPKVRVLASREQMCVNDHVLKAAQGGSVGNLCRVKVQKKECEFYSNYESNPRKQSTVDSIIDIEDLALLSREQRVCPYYTTRDNIQQAELFFVPYNYLIDPIARKAQNIDISNAIVIFDEGHNLESNCTETFSFDISQKLMTMSAIEVQSCIDIIGKTRMRHEFSSQEYNLLKNLIGKINQELMLIQVNGSLVRPGEWILEFFRKVNLNYNNCQFVFRILDSAIDVLVSDPLRANKSLHLQELSTALHQVFREQPLNETQLRNAFKCFKVHIGEQVNPSTKKPEKTISLWCFSSGVAMKQLVNESGIRSVILASGTLSPLSSFAVEMGIPFNIRLENDHVIEKSQISVSVLGKGPLGTKLNSSFETRNSLEYINDMGNCIMSIAKNTPDGLLCFFSSYSIMNVCQEKWRQNGILDRISQFKKCFIEPKNKNLFNQTIQDYYKQVESGKGAVFFAICRGKCSEGIDFSDSKARAVVICGIPYPAAKDPQILLKKQFLDQTWKTDGSLSGNEWYKQQAARAVNQAIGRVIRHKNDFGAIVLCDERFSSSIGQLPVWVRDCVRVHDDFAQFQQEFSSFFKSHIVQVKEKENDPKRDYLEMVKRGLPPKEYKEFYVLLKRLKEKRLTIDEFLNKLKTVYFKGLAQKHAGDKAQAEFEKLWRGFGPLCPKKGLDTFQSLSKINK